MVRAFTFSFILVSALTGCVSVEIPDNLVSNSLESGKNIYLDLTNNNSSPQNESMSKNQQGIYFSNTHVNHMNLSELELKSSCLQELELTAKSKLKTNNIHYSVVSETTSSYNNQLVAYMTEARLAKSSTASSARNIRTWSSRT